ncbi:DUF2190 family protein [Planctomycetes bacterium CA13]|uniref:capsid cement protein n=1 Tax=Novipirellula herctigrandis TaxID=2527986 RepID=UPI0011B6F6C4
MSVAEFVKQGAAVDYTPTAGLVAGSVVVQGELVGITKHDIRAGVLGSVSVVGVFDVTKNPVISVSAGAKVHWDDTNGHAIYQVNG